MTGNDKYDMTIPKPGAFEEFMAARHPGLELHEPYEGIEDMREAFTAGWEAAVLEHC